MSEHSLQNLIRIELSKLGFIVFRANVGKFKLADGRWFDVGLPRGFSDLFAIKDGRVCFIEVKAVGGKVSSEQRNFIEQMKRKGCVAGIAYSVNEAITIAEQLVNLRRLEIVSLGEKGEDDDTVVESNRKKTTKRILRNKKNEAIVR